MSTEHTATPMVLPLKFAKAGNGLRYIYDANGVAIARTLANDGKTDLAASAEFIVRACNAHDDLVKALSRLVKRIDYYASMGELTQKNIEDWAYTDASSDMAVARAALAKVQA